MTVLVGKAQLDSTHGNHNSRYLRTRLVADDAGSTRGNLEATCQMSQMTFVHI